MSQRDADIQVCAMLGEKVRDELGHNGRQALFSAACLMAFADLDLADAEVSYISALNKFLGGDGVSRITTRRQTREQILAGLVGAKLAPKSAVAVVACLSFVALADGVVKPEERELLGAIAGALGHDDAACSRILEDVRRSL